MGEDSADKKEVARSVNTFDLVRSGFERINGIALEHGDKLSSINHNIWLVDLAHREVTYSELLSSNYLVVGDDRRLGFSPRFNNEFGSVLKEVGIQDVDNWIKLVREVDFSAINNERKSGSLGVSPIEKVLAAVYTRAEQAYDDLDKQVVFCKEPALGIEMRDGQHQLVGDIASFLGQYVFVHQNIESFGRRVEDFGVVRFDPRSIYTDAYGMAFKMKGFENHLGLPFDFGLNASTKGSDLNIAAHELTHYLGHQGELSEAEHVWFASALGEYLGHSFPFKHSSNPETTNEGSLPVLSNSRLVTEGLVSGAVEETGQAFFVEMSRIIKKVGLSTGTLESQVAIRVGVLSAAFAVQLSRYYQDWEVGLAFMVALVRPAGSLVYAEAVANRFAELKKENTQPSYIFREEHRDWPADLLSYRYLLYVAEESCQKLRF